MNEIVYTRKFKKHLKRISGSGRVSILEINIIIDVLSKDDVIDLKYKNHRLLGDLNNYHECHLRPDVLLVYRRDDSKKLITLIDIGSHSNLFH